ncbi:MAG: hypothetical protein AAB434_02560 [Planctomycetota bacterium]
MDLRSFLDLLCQRAGWPRTDLPDGSTAITVVLVDGRKQDVFVSRSEEEGLPLARILTHVGPLSRLSGEKTIQALRMNAELRFGGFAIVDDHLVMTDSVLIAAAEVEELEQSLRYLARQADLAEKFLFGTDER